MAIFQLRKSLYDLQWKILKPKGIQSPFLNSIPSLSTESCNFLSFLGQCKFPSLSPFFLPPFDPTDNNFTSNVNNLLFFLCEIKSFVIKSICIEKGSIFRTKSSLKGDWTWFMSIQCTLQPLWGTCRVVEGKEIPKNLSNVNNLLNYSFFGSKNT